MQEKGERAVLQPTRAVASWFLFWGGFLAQGHTGIVPSPSLPTLVRRPRREDSPQPRLATQPQRSFGPITVQGWGQIYFLPVSSRAPGGHAGKTWGYYLHMSESFDSQSQLAWGQHCFWFVSNIQWVFLTKEWLRWPISCSLCNMRWPMALAETAGVRAIKY